MLIVNPERDLRIDLDTGVARYGSDEGKNRSYIRLGRRERVLLAYLARHCNELVSRQQLQSEVFADRKNGTASLTSAISQIRQLLTNVDPACKCLLTIYGQGYLFDPALSELEVVDDEIRVPHPSILQQMVAARPS
ncbi:transcriptional regulator [Uliginosibacterium sp. sgz301328]|uniref:winged helix-turn-helix domain-containing protein n=1 Tax=Uliginosibacterium sp. sgz301328 TaxID=3243764 RepID=UPI00359D0051